MIEDYFIGSIKETAVILHSFTLTRDGEARKWKYLEDANPNHNDGKRHRVRAFIIAHNDVPYPDTTKLKALMAIPTSNHSNITNSEDYGSKLGGFCPTCLASVKAECKKKFGGNW